MFSDHKSAALAVAFLAATLPQARAALTISNQPTANVACAAGVCTATAVDAVLNADELAGMLAAAAVQVQSGETAQDIVLAAPLAWASATTLTLDAWRSIAVIKPVAVRGFGNLTLLTNDGGSAGALSFGGKGHIRFRHLTSLLSIDGRDYVLLASIAELASAIAAHPRGAFALADDYDASQDGAYSRVPIPTPFSGIFEGLGNTISNLAMFDTADNDVALFRALNHKGVLRDVGVIDVNILSENTFFQVVGTLVAFTEGTIIGCYATGQIRSDFRMTGGGLAGENFGTILQSFADVFVSGAQNAEVGGLVGNSHGPLHNVYALGRVIAGDESYVGGLIGYSFSRIESAYATGDVDGGQNALVGGFIGQNFHKVRHGYWDVTTSGTDIGVANGEDAGVKGRSTEQLQAGLPRGFDPAIWGQDPHLNDGLPYLLAAPPSR